MFNVDGNLFIFVYVMLYIMKSEICGKNVFSKIYKNYKFDIEQKDNLILICFKIK